MQKVPVIGINRLRMGTDGHGVTTLVAFHGCPLWCKYCLNPQCLLEKGKLKEMTPQEIFDEVKKDALYFLTTNGGITFGGGEPLLRPEIILEILETGAKRWHTSIETSLNVPRDNIEKVTPYINEYIIDIKDMNTQIYKNYTGKDNWRVIDNLKWLVSKVESEKILVRIPLIEGYNTIEDQDESEKQLKSIGITRIQRFKYITDVNEFKQKHILI